MYIYILYDIYIYYMIYIYSYCIMIWLQLTMQIYQLRVGDGKS